MNDLIEYAKNNGSWIYYALTVLGILITIYRYIKKLVEQSAINDYMSLIREVPLSIKNIERNQTLLYSEIQVQSKTISAILDTLELAHFLCDSTGNCIKVNSKWITLTGLPERDALGHNWLLAIHPDDREHVQEKWQDMVDNFNPFEEVFRYQHRITQQITGVKCHATDVMDDAGKRVFILGFSRVQS